MKTSKTKNHRTLKAPNNKIQVAALLLQSMAMLAVAAYMDRSATLREFLKKTENLREHTEFAMYVVIGLIKYGLLVAGLAIPVVLVLVWVIRKKKKIY